MTAYQLTPQSMSAINGPVKSDPPSVAPSEWDRSYAAGWFDSRGYIRMSTSQGRAPRLTLHIQSGRCNPIFFFERWGGKYAINAGKLLQKKKSIQSVNGVCSWQISRLPAKKFLDDIAPYAPFRAKQIAAAQEFLSVLEATCMDKKEQREKLTKLAEQIRLIGIETATWTD